ncbi:hypothetical protein BGX27_007339 [Mortierella sp. AM989]|nr:hypothetical protein BGX27_007339 [Mortierella sp. AM989]
MRFSTAAALVAVTSMALLTTSPFSHENTVVSAALTPEERIEVEAKDPNNPNYCPACLKKALHNHFPHACPKGVDPIAATTRAEGPQPHEQRCICFAFMELSWMKKDCSKECSFVHNPTAMEYFVSAQTIKGCDKWVDFEKGEEKEIEGYAKKDPNHKPEVFSTEKEGAAQDENNADEIKQEQKQDNDQVEKEKEDNAQVVQETEQVEAEASKVQPEEPKVAEVVVEEPKAHRETKDEL